jgi:class 3 adenylate cyclase
MAYYDFQAGKKRIDDILRNRLEIIEKDEVPSDSNFTFNNGYYCWVTALFVDIRDSSDLFADEDREKVSKIIRSFSSETIEILRSSEKLREIGIRGDCVYAIYTTPLKHDIRDIVDRGTYVNTLMKELNQLLEKKKYPTIEVGIGIATAQELVVKAGRKDVGINSKVWIGDAVTRASNLSSLGNKGYIRSIVLSSLAYENMIDLWVKLYGKGAKSWFKERYDDNYGTYYDGDVVDVEFNDWIDGGMEDE